MYKRDSDANSNALSQDTAFNGIKASTDKRVKSSAKKNSVFAGDLNLSDSTASRIEQKRNGARKQAKKLIQDAWDKDTKALGSIQDMEKDKADKVNEITDLKAKSAEIKAEHTKKFESYLTEEQIKTLQYMREMKKEGKSCCPCGKNRYY